MFSAAHNFVSLLVILALSINLVYCMPKGKETTNAARKKTSPVWDTGLFEKFVKNGKKMVRCKECNIEFLIKKSSTTPLLEHLKKEHKEYAGNTSQEQLFDDQSMLSAVSGMGQDWCIFWEGVERINQSSWQMLPPSLGKFSDFDTAFGPIYDINQNRNNGEQ